jgi:hypothetical protein
MGILGHVWNVATSLMPAGMTINKIGRTIGKNIYDSGILGKIAKKSVESIVPKNIRTGVSEIAEKTAEMLPEGKVKNIIQSTHRFLRPEKNNEYRKSVFVYF